MIVRQISYKDIPVPLTAKSPHQGKWHRVDELYHIITNLKDVNQDVPPGDKSTCFLLINNQRNMSRLASGNNKKYDFYDECCTWDHSKENTCKTTYVVTDASLSTLNKCKNTMQSCNLIFVNKTYMLWYSKDRYL